MSDRLLVRLAPDGSFCWRSMAVDGASIGETLSGLPPAALREAAREIVVLVPGADVLVSEVSLSARSRTQLMRALPYAVEDQLLDPVEEMHFAASAALGSSEGGIRYGIAAVLKTRMRQWVEHLAAADVRADVVLPDTLALSLHDGKPVGLIDAERALVRLAPFSTFVCAPTALDDWLAHIGVERASLDINDLRSPPRANSHNSALSVLAAGLTPPALNMLQGEFAPAHRHAREALLWRKVALAAAAVLVFAIVGLILQNAKLKGESQQLQVAIEQGLHKALPQLDASDLANANPETLLGNRLRDGSNRNGDVLDLLARIAPVLGTGTRVQTRGIEYHNDTLELALRAPDVAMLDSVRERLAALPQLHVEVTGANPGKDGVDGRIRIVGANP
ncbi:MAG: type II secretion system protein GspL [Dokdonella sp.]